MISEERCIAFDVSPLSHERTGVNNYIRGSLAGLAEAARPLGHEIVAFAPKHARIVDTAPLTLDLIIAEIEAAHARGQDVSRLHSGDLSVWSAMGEQLRRLRGLNIPYDVTPGVPSFAAAAAALGAELTLPGIAQSVVLTRTSGRASAIAGFYLPAEPTIGLRPPL